jgi:hypothetical protein
MNMVASSNPIAGPPLVLPLKIALLAQFALSDLAVLQAETSEDAPLLLMMSELGHHNPLLLNFT